MKNKTIIALVIAGVAAVTAFVFLASGVSIYNDQARLKNLYEMKIKSNEAEFDNMWKKLQQTAQIPDAQKEAFKDVFTSYAKARTVEGQGRVMAWVKEAIPNYNGKIFTKLMNIVIGSRDGWTSRQNELVDIARQYNANLVVFPKNILLPIFGFAKIDPKIITSSRTEETFKTGKDDDVTLFPKK